MARWPYRHQLSIKDRLRRSVYEVLRDQMDFILINYALVDSYWKFCKVGQPYPFVPKRELKPRARVCEQEYVHQNTCFVIFCEGAVPSNYKKYIRFFDSNKVTKETVSEFDHVQFSRNYTKNIRYFDNPDFGQFVLDLSPIDYALLVQQDPAVRRQNRYMMTHFHVRIDWPIDEATEDMAHHLRYISKDLYERGEEYAQQLYHKLFENYGFHHSAGGRRTAAVVAAQLLRRMEFISTIYVASSENRTLVRISERGVTKYVLVQVPMKDIFELSAANGMKCDIFIERYLIDIKDEYGVGILQAVHRNTNVSKPPEDGRIRRLRPDYQWLTINEQLLMPLASHWDQPPIPYSTIYS